MSILGIDISKKKFSVTLIDTTGAKHYQEFANTETGFKSLSKWLDKPDITPLHACMEATNIYWEALADYLHSAEYQVSVVNPSQIKGFAQSQLQRNKTDKQDSQVIADFCQQTSPKLWSPPRDEDRKVRALSRHLETLKKELTSLKNRLQTSRDEDVTASLNRMIEQLEGEIKAVQKKVQEFIDQTPELKETQRLLSSIIGIGLTTAIKLMAELYDLVHYENARAVSSDVGVTPSHHQSGETVNRKSKMSKVGKASVRAALYFPAIVALTHNPLFQQLKERLEKRGKPKKVIIGAAMRKLLHLAYGVLKNKTPFDPDYAL